MVKFIYYTYINYRAFFLAHLTYPPNSHRVHTDTHRDNRDHIETTPRPHRDHIETTPRPHRVHTEFPPSSPPRPHRVHTEFPPRPRLPPPPPTMVCSCNRCGHIRKVYKNDQGEWRTTACPCPIAAPAGAAAPAGGGTSVAALRRAAMRARLHAQTFNADGSLRLIALGSR
jgi:hypothetical protein